MTIIGQPPARRGGVNILERGYEEGISASSIDEAIHRTQQFLLNLQHPDGYWVGQLEADISIESDIILLMHFLGRVDRVKQTRLVNRILNEQLSEGGWSIYHGGQADINTTVKAYLALIMAGISCNEPFMKSAKECAIRLGGAESVNSFTKIYLAIFGQGEWDQAPAIPPEIILFPGFFYLNIYEMSAWSRTIIVPLSIIYALKPCCRVSGAINIRELFSGKSPASSYKFFSWKNFFIIINKVLKFLEKSPVKPLRKIALKRAERWMLTRFDASHGLGGIFPAIVNSIFALKALGYRDGDPVLERQIIELERLEIEEDGILKIQPCLSPIWDTALSIVALIRSGLSPDHPAVVKAAKYLIKKEVRDYGDWHIKNRKARPSGWFFEFENKFYPDVDDTAMVLIALSSVRLSGDDYQKRNAAIQRGIDWILSMQNRDNGFSSFDRDNNKIIFTQVPFADHNAMLDPSSNDITGRVLELFGMLGFSSYYPPAARAIKFLKKNQRIDGSWYGRWGVNYIYGTSQVLRGFRSIGDDLQDVNLRKAAQWIVSCQNIDGGWGESCHSYNDPLAAGIGPSTPSQTAWALIGLMSAGRSEDSESIIRGLDYLIRTQNQDGSWDEPYFTGTGFPVIFYLKYHLYRVYFPLLALGMYKRCGSQSD